jgi:hypothetical protein
MDGRLPREEKRMMHAEGFAYCESTGLLRSSGKPILRCEAKLLR